jgi:hypothetical protein
MNKIFGAHFVAWCISGGQRESISNPSLPRVEKVATFLGAFLGLQSLAT